MEKRFTFSELGHGQSTELREKASKVDRGRKVGGRWEARTSRLGPPLGRSRPQSGQANLTPGRIGVREGPNYTSAPGEDLKPSGGGLQSGSKPPPPPPAAVIEGGVCVAEGGRGAAGPCTGTFYKTCGYKKTKSK